VGRHKLIIQKEFNEGFKVEVLAILAGIGLIMKVRKLLESQGCFRRSHNSPEIKWKWKF
jgi:hypothetical protein